MKQWLADALRDIADRIAPANEWTEITWPKDIEWSDGSSTVAPMSGSFLIHTDNAGRTWTVEAE